MAHTSWNNPVTKNALLGILQTKYRTIKIHNLVELTPRVREQYHCLRYNEVFPIDTTPPRSMDALTGEQLMFEAVSTASALPPIDAYHDFIEHIECDTIVKPSMILQWLNQLEQYNQVYHVYCVSDTKPDLICSTPYSYNTMLTGGVDLLRTTNNTFLVIFNSGASKAISGFKEDFVDKILAPPRELRLGIIEDGMFIEGTGTVVWEFLSKGKHLVIHTQCYYVPSANVRLISPQRLFNKKNGVNGEFTCKEDNATLIFSDLPALDIDYDSRNHLPIAPATKAANMAPQMNFCITTESKQNLTPTQRPLLQWHLRFLHKNFNVVRKILRSFPFTGEKYTSAARCSHIECEVCRYAKSRRTPTKGNKQSTNRITDVAIKSEFLRSGARVSVDHFESRQKGITYTSFGKTTSNQYKGECAFFDAMSSYAHVEHQLGFYITENIRAK